MEYFLVVLYVFLLSILILKSKYFEIKGLPRQFLLFVFILKVLVSFFYGFISWKYNWGDTHAYFNASKTMAEFLPHDPLKFLRLVFGPNFESLPQSYQEVIHQEWIHYYGLPRSGFIVKVHALMQIFSFGYYSVHCVFFAFISLIGITYIYDFFNNFSHRKHFLLIFFIYFTPSILFWMSGAHKDALTIFGLGMILFSLKRIIHYKHTIYVLVFALSSWFTFSSRNYVFLLFVPPLIAFLISLKGKMKPLPIFAMVYLAAIVFFFNGNKIHPKLNFPQKIVEAQDYFSSLQGRTSFEMEALQPNFQSFITAMPSALKNSFLRPSINTTHTWFDKLAFAENCFILLIIIGAIYYTSFKKLNRDQVRIALFCFAFSISYFLLLGLTVNNVGALVRYKSTALMFLGIGLITIINGERLPKIIQHIQIKNKPWQLKDNMH